VVRNYSVFPRAGPYGNDDFRGRLGFDRLDCECSPALGVIVEEIRVEH